MQVVFPTHPEVAVVPDVPVPRWGLSAAGRVRLEHALAEPWLRDLTGIVSSAERKAWETAGFLAAAVGRPVTVDEDLGQSDQIPAPG